jgi:hypothetical protein
MRGDVMAHRIVVETRVEDRIKEVLERFVGQRFSGITITAVERQYKVDGRWADIAVLKGDVVGQAVACVTILKHRASTCSSWPQLTNHN